MARGVSVWSIWWCSFLLLVEQLLTIDTTYTHYSLAMMKEGGKATLVIPPELAYGDAGSGGAVPPGATLKFEVELFKVNP